MTRLHFANTRNGDMCYLVQQHISDPFFLLDHDGVRRIFLGHVDIEAFRTTSEEDIEAVAIEPFLQRVEGYHDDSVAALGAVILDEYGVSGEVTVPHSFPHGVADMLAKLKGDVQLVADTEWGSERWRKSPKEISAIRENLAHTTKAFALIEKILRESKIDANHIIYDKAELTSEFLKREVGKLLLDYDLTNPEGMIISCGKHAAMPHHDGVGLLRPHETIIVDLFPQSTANHYFADMTRTYVKGVPSDRIVKMYESVLEAHEASLRALRAGVTGSELYEISAASIRAAGFDVGEKGYTHSLGHGLGVEVHEPPYLGKRGSEPLEAGTVVTIEPGLYYPDIGGVRIEDTVLVTENGYENLTNYPKNWLIP